MSLFDDMMTAFKPAWNTVSVQLRLGELGEREFKFRILSDLVERRTLQRECDEWITGQITLFEKQILPKDQAEIFTQDRQILAQSFFLANRWCGEDPEFGKPFTWVAVARNFGGIFEGLLAVLDNSSMNNIDAMADARIEHEKKN